MSETFRTPATMIDPRASAYAGAGVGAAHVPASAVPDPAVLPAVPRRNPYAAAPPMPPRRAVFRLAGCVLTLLVMAALCIGAIYLMWRFSGR
ncbi:MAG: hypothetical protein SOY67_08100 [Collinsella sp.]|nr:hypothetical protein [Collinsella sp.]